MKRNFLIGSVLLVLAMVLGVGSALLQKRAAVQAAGLQAPMFEVDPMWPTPLPHRWVNGRTIGVSVISKDPGFIVVPKRAG